MSYRGNNKSTEITTKPAKDSIPYIGKVLRQVTKKKTEVPRMLYNKKKTTNFQRWKNLNCFTRQVIRVKTE